MSLIFFVRFIHQLFFSTAVAARSKEHHSGEADPQIYVIRGLRGECYTKSYTKFNYNEKPNIGRISAFGFGAAAVRPTCTNRFIEADLTPPPGVTTAVAQNQQAAQQVLFLPQKTCGAFCLVL